MIPKTLQIDNTEIFYTEFGDGAIPVVYIPGWLPTIDNYPYRKIYNDDFARTSKGFKFLIINLPNTYKSDFNFEVKTLDDYSDFIRKILDKLGYTEVHLLGHSAGGRFAIHFHNKYPDYVDKFVLMNSAGLKHRSATAKMLKKVNYYFGKFSVTEVQREFLEEVYSNIYNSDLTEMIQSIERETLIIWGEKDPTIKVTKAYVFHKLIRGSELKVFPRVGHMTIMNKDVQEFLFEYLRRRE